MRLLNTRTETLSEFFTIPRYAILSHTWGEEEVTFKDLDNDKFGNHRKLKGYGKISGSCAVALREGFEWIWIDTCCIDKSSSAELSEAINSMFKWYKDSAVCYAYLADVEDDQVTANTHSFLSSRWFTRGWTLQELVAPSTLVFLNAGWDELGTKITLAGIIATITGIEKDVLAPLPVVTSTGWGPQLHVSDIHSTLRQCSIAQRMSWAANRTTTRVEDQAYSLMGIFGINMPLLYGEGTKAFLRLQKEIMHQSDDMSIFVWRYPRHSMPNWTWSGLLAPSPDCFESYRDVRQYDYRDGISTKKELSPVQQHASRTPDVSNTHVQLTVSTLRLRKTTDKLRAWSRTATGLLRSRSSLLNGRHGTSAHPTSPDFLDLDQFYRSTSDPLEENGLILVILLDCWTPSGQIGLVLVDKQPAPLVRHHSRTVFAPLLLKKHSSIAFSPLQDVRCKLFSDDVFAAPGRMLVFDPQARFTMRIVELGYTYSTIEKWGDKYSFGPASSSVIAGFPCLDARPLVLLMRNTKNPEWPGFAMHIVFEFRDMRAKVSLLHLDNGSGSGPEPCEPESSHLRDWLERCRQVASGQEGFDMSQARLAFRNSKKGVVVKIRPSLGGIDVIVHARDGVELERRLTGLTLTDDGRQ